MTNSLQDIDAKGQPGSRLYSLFVWALQEMLLGKPPTVFFENLSSSDGFDWLNDQGSSIVYNVVKWNTILLSRLFFLIFMGIKH